MRPGIQQALVHQAFPELIDIGLVERPNLLIAKPKLAADDEGWAPGPELVRISPAVVPETNYVCGRLGLIADLQAFTWTNGSPVQQRSTATCPSDH